MSDYTLLAFDLDGTLLNSRGQILESSKQAIQCAREQGVKVVLVTGRHHVAVRPYHHELGLDTPVVCCNGAYIMDFAQGKPVYSNPLPKDKARQIIAMARDFDMDMLMYVNDAMTFERLNPHMEKMCAWALQQPEQVRPTIRQIDDILQTMESAESIYKFVLSHRDQHHFLSAYQQLAACGDFSCERSWVDRMDIANTGNSKGATLKRLADQWNIAPANIIAVGDNDNDITMVAMAGLGVAMGESSEPLRAQADIQIGSHDDDSIAQLIARYVTGKHY